MAVRILSIDGGGLRGVFPLWVLQSIEKYTEKKIFDCFDFFAGSSTGGIISAGLTIPQTLSHTNSITKRVPKLGVEELINLYQDKGKEIFPVGNVLKEWYKNRIWSYLNEPMYSSEGLQGVLSEFFGDLKIGDCMKPIMIPSYCISTMEPIWFRSRITKPSKSKKINFELAESHNIKLVDALMASTAAPTYLPAFSLKFGLDPKNSQPIDRLCIDGGIYQNNPTSSALVELFRNLPEYSEKFGTELHESLDNIFVLSIGTGRFNEPIKNRLELANGGKLNWARPAIDVSMWGNAQAVDFQVAEWMDLATHTNQKINYLRINFELTDSKFEEMTNSSTACLNYYKEIFQKEFQNKPVVRSKLVDFLDGAGI